MMIKKVFFVVSFLTFLFLSGTFAIYASDASVKVSSAAALEGEKISIDVTVTTTDKSIGGFKLYLTYDESIIEYQSGAEAAAAGKLTLFYVMQDANTKKVEKKITFIAKKPGESALEIDAQSEINDDTDDYALFNIQASGGKATVTAPIAKSGNCNIKSVVVYAVSENGSSKKVSLTPAFSADKTEYTLDVEYDISKLSIKAVAEDGKTGIKIGGLSLKEGDNITAITATAENGNTKKYYIYTNRAKAPKEPVTTTAPASPGPTTPSSDSYIDITVGGIKKYVPLNLGMAAVPEGFEEQKYTYNGIEIAAARGLSKNLIIVYMLDEKLENGKFYIYDEAASEFYDMVNIQTSGKMYTIVRKPGDVLLPEGYKDVSVQIDGVDVSAWAMGDTTDFYYVYAMNYNGESGMYRYDSHEKTMQRVYEYSYNFSRDEEYESISGENAALILKQQELDRENKKLKNNSIKNYIIIAAVTAVIVGAATFMIMRRIFGKKPADYDEKS